MHFTWYELTNRILELKLTIRQTGAGTTASRLGQPDLALAQLYDMKSNADIIANLAPGRGPPLIADMDTGFGGKTHLQPLTTTKKHEPQESH